MRTEGLFKKNTVMAKGVRAQVISTERQALATEGLDKKKGSGIYLSGACEIR
jgi:hypothetical protein